MKVVSLSLVATVVLAGYLQAQTAQAPASAPAASTSASAPSSGSEHLGHACKEEVRKLCGRAHGDAMQQCIKSSLDLNKFSADCKAKLAQPAKPDG